MPSRPTLILASTSPYRRSLLDRLSVAYVAADPAIDEELWRELAPEPMVLALAQAKAEAIEHPDALVIGSDQCVDLDGEVLGKPGTAARAVAQLERLAGRRHRLLTAVAVHDTRTGETRVDLDVHTLTMRALSRDSLEAYVRADQPMGCAGAYMLERRGVALFESIEADPKLADDTAIIGLPMLRTLRLLRDFGVDPLEWPISAP
jgi:septum formation protein